jgi:hypothetical protein
MADCRETPAFHIWTLLENMGAHVSYHDPYVAEIKVRLYLNWLFPKSFCVCPSPRLSPPPPPLAIKGEQRSHAKLNGQRSTSLKDGLASADVRSCHTVTRRPTLIFPRLQVAVVVTNHGCMEWGQLQGFAGVVVDTRRVLLSRML